MEKLETTASAVASPWKLLETPTEIPEEIRTTEEIPKAAELPTPEEIPEESPDQPDWCEEEDEADHSSENAQAMASQHPLADALFSELGAHLDAGEAERKLYNDLEEKLWSGQVFHDRGSADKPAKPAPHPYHAKARLERLLCKSIDVRERYQRRLFDNHRQIPDLDFKRSLDNDETKAIHNAWMNDVSDWMSADCLQRYNFLLAQAEELDKQTKTGKGKEKPPKGMKKAVLQSLLTREKERVVLQSLLKCGFTQDRKHSN